MNALMPDKNLETAKRYQKELRIISNVLSLLNWDLETYMPKSAAIARAEQTAFLEKFYHEKITSEELFNSLKEIDKNKISEDDKLSVERFDKEITRARKIPIELVDELARTVSLAFSAWQEARAASRPGSRASS